MKYVCLGYALALGLALQAPSPAQAQQTRAAMAVPALTDAQARQLIQGWVAARSVSAEQAGSLVKVLSLDGERSLRALRVGRAVPVAFVDPQQLLAGRDIAQASHGASTLRYVLWDGQTPVGLATLEPDARGRYQVVGVGASGLANEIEAVALQQPGQGGLRLVRSRQGVADFLEVRDGGQAARYVPLAAARANLALDAAAATAPQALTAAQATPVLRAAVAAALKRP
ncbi:hypothetical protein K4L06_12000 [Lysobacter sp. BMK333-48F3]|uniref:hypothetical protein n=1 Tax=Lysobacter sp. BMK333-48F3 TaxID=2867962 RepID=UPI001C8B4AA1|nr:hypothetical protein [Lysobacter sp. BMK333-48F3]MBX9402029.1 hypothetical protein [Lysobacter sp. BMK333-48F3]